MMDILLVSANREKSPYPVFPLGLSYLAGPLTDRGHRLRALDLCFAEDPHRVLQNELADFPPAAVVVSIRNLDNVTFPATRSYLADLKAILDSCRGRAPVIVGGSGFSLMPAEMMAHLDADFGVVGEGEEVLPELLDRLEDGRTVHTLPSVLIKGETTFRPMDLSSRIGMADRTLFSVARYHAEGGMANLQTKRGCPFSCIYCSYPLLEGSQVRLRPIDEVVAEIRSLIEDHDVSYLYFVDDVFNYPPEYAEDLCRTIVRERLFVKWCAFVSPGFSTPSLFQTMLAAGCDAVEFGCESGSEAMLKSLGKSFTVSDIRSASRLCRELGLDFAHYLLFGGPGESEATIDETFALMDDLAPSAVIAMTGIRIFPGTQLHRLALEEGVITPDTSLLEPVFYVSPQMKDTLCELVARRVLTRRNWVSPGVELNMSDAVLEALCRFPVSGPTWKGMKRLNRIRLR